MIVNDFSNIVMSSLFGELAGYDNCKGISHLALGNGIESWDSGTIPSISATDSGLYIEKYRIFPYEVLFLDTVTFSGSDILYVNDSGFRVNISIPYPNYHFNELSCNISASGSGVISRNILNYSYDSGTIELDSEVSGLENVTQIEIPNSVMIAGEYSEEVLYKFRVRSNEKSFEVIREEGLVGAGATEDNNTGYFGIINRFRGRPVGGRYIHFDRQYKLTVGEEFFIK